MSEEVKKGAGAEDRMKEWIKFWEDGTMAEMHAKKPHPKIIEHFDKLINGKSHAKIFFPFCGDVVDMVMCVEKGHSIVGVECSELGVKSFFSDNNIDVEHVVCDEVKGKLYKSKDGRYKIYCCDLFNFNESIEGQFDAIVDFGSMGAVYKKDLQAYADLMKSVMKPDCRHFLECFIYDLDKYPDSLPNCFKLEHLQGFYGDQCDVEMMEEGPNPYEECEANVTDKSTPGDDVKGDNKEDKGEKNCEEEFPPITGAAYFMITPKDAP